MVWTCLKTCPCGAIPWTYYKDVSMVIDVSQNQRPGTKGGRIYSIFSEEEREELQASRAKACSKEKAMQMDLF